MSKFTTVLFEALRNAVWVVLVAAVAIAICVEIGWLPRDPFAEAAEPAKEKEVAEHTKVRGMDLPNHASRLQRRMAGDPEECWVRDQNNGRDVTILYQPEPSGECWSASWHLNHACSRITEALEEIVLDEQFREMGIEVDEGERYSTTLGTLEKRHPGTHHQGGHGLVTVAGEEQDFPRAQYCKRCTPPSHWIE